MPTLPPRQAILTELLTRVSGIQIADGYSTDAGLLVLFGETPMLGPEDPATAIAILVRDDAPDDLGGYGGDGGDSVTKLPIEVQGIARADQKNPWLTVEDVIADVRRAVESADPTIGGLLTKQLQRGRVRPLNREPGATSIGASQLYTATFVDPWVTA